MKKLFFIFSLLVISKLVIGQKINDLVIINLKSGFPVKGTVTEIIPNDYIKIKLTNEEVLKVLYSEVKSIKIDENERIRLQDRIEKQDKIKKNEKIIAQKIKVAEQQRIKDSLNKVQKMIKNESLLKEPNLYNYLYLSAGISSLSADKKVIENLVKGTNSIEQFPINNPSQFNGFNLNLEYLINFRKSKNISIAIDFNQVKSSLLTPYAKLDFIKRGVTLNLGHCFYQKTIKATFGSGISIIQNQIITSIDERQNILCGQLNYVSMPIFFEFRYPSTRAFSLWLRPNVNINLISSNIIPTYSINTGMSLLFIKKNKN